MLEYLPILILIRECFTNQSEYSRIRREAENSLPDCYMLALLKDSFESCGLWLLAAGNS